MEEKRMGIRSLACNTSRVEERVKVQGWGLR
jgi:hypothetical protein